MKKYLLKLTSVILCIILAMSSVTAFAADSESPLFYGDVSFPTVSENDSWDASSEDYNTEQNLILNHSAQIMCGTEPTEQQKQYDTPMPAAMLSDGVYSTSKNIHNGMFFEVYTQSHRDIIYDLNHISAVSGFKTSFLMVTDWGIQLPDKVTVKLSADGKDWYSVCDIVLDKIDWQFDREIFTLEKAVAARFVCFSFDTPGVWCGCDEFEVTGTKNAENAASLSETYSNPKQIIQNEFLEPSEDILGGVKDLCLAYHSKTFDWDEKHFEPYVTYLDKDGNAKDVMFDGYLFLLSGLFPSGARGYGASVMSDWTWELDKLFAEGKNIDALNDAAGQAAEKLNLKNFKYKFYITLYYPDYAMKAFGDVDGDGISEDFTNVEDRIKAEKWYIEEFYKRYDAASYDNIKFGGFYWYNESIGVTERNLTLLNGVADVVHSHNTQFFWIPYYNAGGCCCPYDFGFDAACLQPNYVFDKTTPTTQYEKAIALSKRYGMGIEIETHNGALTDSDYLEKYLTYLKGGITHGYGNALHMYYQDVLTFYTAYNSSDETAHAVYDLTYMFIKGTLKLSPDAKNTSISTNENTCVNSELYSEKSVLPTEYTLTSDAQNGTLTVNSDGSYTYIPNNNFYGTDCFTYTYNNMIDESETCTVSITVNHVHQPIVNGTYIAPTCTKDGKEDDIICSECQDILSTGELIPTTGHADNDNDGICDICNENLVPKEKTFLEKIIDFFTKIINWFNSLFGKA